MEQLLELKNYIGDSFEEGDTKKTLTGFDGRNIGTVYGANEVQIRKAKRTLVKNITQLERIEVPTVIEILKKSMDYCYSTPKDFEITSILSGSPISFVKKQITELKNWCKKIDEYLYSCFGAVDYSLIEVKRENKILAYKKYVPKGPIAIILPQNDDGLALYVLAQAFLSRNPSIVKPSTSGASAFATIKFIEAINEAIEYFGKEEAILKQSFQVINILEEGDKKSKLTANLAVDGGQVVVFGTDKTTAMLEKEISKEVKIKDLIKMGTGFSISVVLDDANIENTVQEIIHSATQDRGNKCTTTSVVYSEKNIYRQLIQKLKEYEPRFPKRELLHPETKLGRINEVNKKQIMARLRELYNLEEKEHEEKDYLGLIICELQKNQYVEEVPAPILFVKEIDTIDEILKQVEEDIKKNNLEKNLITSVYTNKFEAFQKVASKVPSHLFKYNKSSERMNFLIEHQGRFLIKDFLDLRTLEM